jgi:hypothetical protein
MAFDQATRNLLARFVSDARRLIAEEFTYQFQSLYGISDSGEITSLHELRHLDESQKATAARLRERINYLVESHLDETKPTTAAVERLAREQAFTILNRLAAIRMAEKRGLIVESVGKGYQSKGFQVYSQVAWSGLGEIYDRYRRYLFCLFDELAVDLGVLFDRLSPSGILFPREKALLDLIKLLNASDLEALWAEDETIGWIYQYYNDPVERKKMREKSAAPRNSYELAVRNQFFTPRYVVEFLTDNTLGRIWYEMTWGETKLKEQCRYLVRRPNEIFLKPGEAAPEQSRQDNLSQEDQELLKQAVFIPHRALKDPRTILMLDPACGSMHFGLYAFDLFEVIYDEAWELEEKLGADALSHLPGMKSLHDTYAGKDAFLKDVPRLIIEHNLHGIDIDPRCAQIAGLSLWLRAQKAWQRLGLKPAERPAIKRSNIVCAEPMPGEKELLREFVEREFPAEEQTVFLRLLESIFDKMQLAGEAGSLLKIEEEIRSAITEAKKLWKEGPQLEQSRLFADLEPVKQKELKIDLSGITDEQFWDSAESRIYAALRDYAGQAENGGGFRRRLFAEDAAQGFAFIDVCRKRYDVAVTNPPFGEFSAKWKKEASEAFPDTRNDIFGAFTERMLELSVARGFVGAITSRTGFFLTSFNLWRTNVILGKASLRCVADLGDGVMDNAMVEAAAYFFEKAAPKRRALFIRGLLTAKKEEAIADALESVRKGLLAPNAFYPPLEHFSILPDGPFVYWSNPRALTAFASWPALKDSAGDVRQGLATADDPRFARAIWEAPYDNRRFTDNGKAWTPYVKAGASQPWFSPITLLVNWGGDAAELWNNLNARGKVRSNIWMLRDAIRLHFFKPGFSWTRRAARFIPYVIPEGCIPSASRYLAYPHSDKTFSLIGVAGSNAASVFLRFYGEMFQRPNYMVETVKLLPWPKISGELETTLKQLIDSEVRQRRRAYQNHEPFHEFTLPFKLWSEGRSVNALEFDYASLLTPLLERDISTAFGLTSEDFASVSLDFCEALAFRRSGGNEDEGDDEKDFVIDVSEKAQQEELMSYALGCAIGRWDIRYGTGELAAPELPDPFAPLPVCPPGQLQNAQGLPAHPEDVPAAYPLKNIPWGGILVDDPNHPQDIERRVREIIEIIWKDRADAIEQEACEILGVKSLRDYFRKPTGFFADHLKRYSKSRRRAPIYWPLSTANGSYTLWIYYHRLTDQTLHTAIADFVDPKIKALDKEIAALRERVNGSWGNQAGELVDFQDELKALRAELERVIKLPWKPNLNDGVLITASPLWNRFRLTKWQKDLKACWEALEKGDCDWAHLAYSIWPRRVEKLCETDRSVAIAHGLEHLYKGETSKMKPKRRKKKAEVEETEVSSEL